MARLKNLAAYVEAEGRVHLPQRPRIVSDTLVLPAGDKGLLLQGRAPVLFSGPHVAKLFPRLLPLLDGTRTLDDICRALPKVSPDRIRDLLAFLFVEGVTEEGWDSSVASPEYAQQAAFFSRYNGLTYATRNGQQTQHLIETADVLVVGRGQIAATLTATLSRAGMGSLRFLALPDQPPLDLPLPPKDIIQGGAWGDPLAAIAAQELGETGLLVVALDSFDTDLLHRINKHCLARGLRWLPVVATPAGFSTVGPLVAPRKSACYDCYRVSRTVAEEQREARTGAPDAPFSAHLSASLLTTFVAQQAALEIINALTQVCMPQTYDAVLQGEAAAWQFTTRRVHHAPACPACGTRTADARVATIKPDVTLGVAHQENLIQLLHTAAHMPKINTVAHRPQFLRNQKLSVMVDNSYKRYGIRVPVALPPAPESLAGSDGQVDLTALSAILHYTLGARDRVTAAGTTLRRGIPTGGGLGSPNIYVAVLRVPDVPVGLYHYNGRDHNLAPLTTPSSLPDALRALLPGAMQPTAELDTAAVALIFTGNLALLHRKYDLFGYRVVNVDAGIAAQSVRRLATRLHLRFTPQPEFYDDAVGSMLGLYGNDEIPLFIGLLHSTDTKGVAGC